MKSEKNRNIISASTIKGCRVINTSLESVGTIDDLMIDAQSGQVLYAVLSVNTGFLNLGNKYFAIPLEEFELRAEENEAMLNVDKDRLEKAPGFEKDQMPEGPQQEFASEVHSYYGRTSRFTRTEQEGALQDSAHHFDLAGSGLNRDANEGRSNDQHAKETTRDGAHTDRSIF